MLQVLNTSPSPVPRITESESLGLAPGNLYISSLLCLLELAEGCFDSIFCAFWLTIQLLSGLELFLARMQESPLPCPSPEPQETTNCRDVNSRKSPQRGQRWAPLPRSPPLPSSVSGGQNFRRDVWSGMRWRLLFTCKEKVDQSQILPPLKEKTGVDSSLTPRPPPPAPKSSLSM